METSFCHCAHSHSLMADSLQPYGLWPARLLYPWGFSRQEYWSGLPCLPPGDLPSPGIEPRFPAVQVDSLPLESPGKPPFVNTFSLIRVLSLSLLVSKLFQTFFFNENFTHWKKVWLLVLEWGADMSLSPQSYYLVSMYYSRNFLCIYKHRYTLIYMCV